MVVDTRDGRVFWAGSDGALFGRRAAAWFADKRNAELLSPAYQVFELRPT